MKKTSHGYQCSATDLAKFLNCTHATYLDKELAIGNRSAPPFTDPHYFTIEALGLEHEQHFVESLKAEGLSVTTLRDDTLDGLTHLEKTREAMHTGYDIIVQAALESNLWHGKADILRKVARPSKLGDWSYEVMDTKLGQDTQAGAVLQLCVYSDLLSAVQGVTPENMYVVKPGEPFLIDTLRYDDFAAYYRWIKAKLESAIPRDALVGSYPDPVPYCDICRWWSVCDKQRRDDDHLSLVAGVQALHVKELVRQGLPSLKEFALAPSLERPEKGSVDTLKRLQLQAQIQLKQRETKKLQTELLDSEPGEGLARLPQPNAGDLFFDIEGDHFFPNGGIEYLLGIAYRKNDQWQYDPYWGFDRKAEKSAFSRLMEFIARRKAEFPDMHIYHFSPYEPNALKHLMLRHSINAEELDALLREGRFIDLHKVLKESVRAGVEKYGLKEMEVFYGFNRDTKLKTASQALRNVQRALELNMIEAIKTEDLKSVAAYNKEDCVSTAELHIWLESLRSERIANGIDIQRPLPRSDEATENVKERDARIYALMARLKALLPEEAALWTQDEISVFLLINQLEYFRREEKSAVWELYRINELEPEDLLDERKVAYGLTYLKTLPPDPSAKKNTLPVQRYLYPRQEFSGDPGDSLEEIGQMDKTRRKIGTIYAHNLSECTLDIKKRGDSIDFHPASVQINDFIGAKQIESALLQFAANIADDGVAGTGKYQAGRSLLFRWPPRFKTEMHSPWSTDNITDVALTMSSNLDSSVLAIQGPPGTGKTYNGAQMIVALNSMGKRIGVTAISHKVVDNLLKWVNDIATKEHKQVRLAHKDKEAGALDFIDYFNDNKVSERLDDGYIVGGTAFLWSGDAMEEQLDYLFIDEAGQMSLAYALAVSRSARNIVLLGDPQQLDQPQKAAHPDGADVSALKHYIGEHQVIPESQGLFLNTTWRLHPHICMFTSNLYYEGKLQSRKGLEQQIILHNPYFGDHALIHISVTHVGNSNYASEEVVAIADIVDKLLTTGTTWIDVQPAKTVEKKLTSEDIMIIAPYNAQVAALKRHLPELAIGTVDKFQGQEAAVVIYSMTSSSAQEAPRGMSFLYQPNRLNVASSRARCLFILVASPRLFEPECKTVEQMRMANGLCLFREIVG